MNATFSKYVLIKPVNMDMTSESGKEVSKECAIFSSVSDVQELS
jgi:hypothetical protein